MRARDDISFELFRQEDNRFIPVVEEAARMAKKLRILAKPFATANRDPDP